MSELKTFIATINQHLKRLDTLHCSADDMITRFSSIDPELSAEEILSELNVNTEDLVSFLETQSEEIDSIRKTVANFEKSYLQ